MRPPRFKRFLGVYGKPEDIKKKGSLPFWGSFFGSVEIFLSKYTKTITMRHLWTTAKIGVMVIKNIFDYHDTLSRLLSWWGFLPFLILIY